MRVMPDRFSRKWWKLWWAGALDRQQVFLSVMADRLVEWKSKMDQQTYDTVFGVDPEKVRRGEELDDWGRPFLDLGAAVRQDLRLSHEKWDKVYDAVFTRLIGKTAYEAEDAWHK